MNISFFTADVFTDKTFGGAQIAVIPDAEKLDAKQMQTIASELNLSETVFIVGSDPEQNKYTLRLFSPMEEVDFGSHTSVATAHVLASTGKLPLAAEHTPATLALNSGDVPIHVTHESGKPVLTQFSLTTQPVVESFLPTDGELAKILSLDTAAIGFNKFKPRLVSNKGMYMVVPVRSLDELYSAKFNLDAWSFVPNKTASTLLLVSGETESENADFHCRLMGPKIGAHEDPPVGASIPAFGAYLCDHQHVQKGTYSFTVERGRQAFRQSLIHVEMDNKKQEDLTLRVGGSAVMVCEGTLALQ